MNKNTIFNVIFDKSISQISLTKLTGRQDLILAIDDPFLDVVFDILKLALRKKSFFIDFVE